ncbi:MAG: hypothetical protein KGZ72_11670 [Roseovarius sp.]|jgi:predicted permease|nr:hypothetical protein [Roseovarius sp.]
MIAGFTCVRTGYLDGGVITALSAFTVKISLPALIFSAFALNDAETALNWTLSGGYLLGSMISMVIGYLVMSRVFAQARSASWIHGLGATHDAEQVCATALVATTLASFFTVSGLIWNA